MHQSLIEFEPLKEISQLAVRERSLRFIGDFRKSNRLDEWRTGDPGTFKEQEQLLCDILEFEADATKRASTQKPQTKEMVKQARKDLKFQVAAKYSMKKRMRLSEAPEPNSDEPIDDFDARVNGYGPFAPDDESGNSVRLPKRERMS
ncbi:uncharacterized protein LOC129599080 [Paramacrobiotus metropolitanus]|uniref:uncharacterized protein LOC129599080 n=1 Tax=Paramacrobiotus metropolitanus TaxID=2943436 RepID=UPI0024464C84|nr:uncharacterized protein LOC129599080 [Paramacrobiotus metropolitanus]